MYRENTDPAADEELHSLGVSTAKGGTAVALLVSAALLFGVVAGVSWFAGTPEGFEGMLYGAPIAAVAFALPAGLLQRRRHRELRIVRHGEALRLVVEPDGVALHFPLVMHGTQLGQGVGRGSKMHEVYLQLVDESGAAVMLHETRGTIYGAQENWFDDDVDRTTTSVPYDVGGAGTLAQVRDWIRALEARG